MKKKREEVRRRIPITEESRERICAELRMQIIGETALEAGKTQRRFGCLLPADRGRPNLPKGGGGFFFESCAKCRAAFQSGEINLGAAHTGC